LCSARVEVRNFCLPVAGGLCLLAGILLGALLARSGSRRDAGRARQLEEETLAREAHFALQELPLVAALTHADSPVAEDELIPSLLSESDAGLEGCLMLFDESQLAAICHDAGRWLQSMDPHRTVADAWRRLAIIQAYYSSLKPHADAN